jgi:hypothetical protein
MDISSITPGQVYRVGQIDFLDGSRINGKEIAFGKGYLFVKEEEVDDKGVRHGEGRVDAYPLHRIEKLHNVYIPPGGLTSEPEEVVQPF